jgi:hypothetical protein
VSGSGVFASSSSLLIRTHNRARYQAEIPLIAPTEIVEPPQSKGGAAFFPIEMKPRLAIF